MVRNLIKNKITIPSYSSPILKKVGVKINYLHVGVYKSDHVNNNTIIPGPSLPGARVPQVGEFCIILKKMGNID